MQDGQKVKKRPLSDDHIVVPGYHEAIIDDALFDRAQELIVDRRNAPIPGKRKCVNPLTGLIRCGHCGYAVRMSNAGRGLDGAYLKCTYINTCTSFGIRFRPVEQVVLNTLQSWVDYDVSRLPEEQKHEELMNLRNGFNFAKKVMTTGECDVLILDEILGIVDQGIISAEEFRSFLEARDEETDLVMTGRVCPEGIEKYVDEISVVSTGKNLRISQAENIDIDNHQE